MKKIANPNTCLLMAILALFGVARPLYADFRFTLTGDPRNGYSRWEWTLSEMASKVGDEGVFHITAGDYYEGGAVTTASGFYDRLKTEFGDDVVWYPTVGNHETGTTDMPWLRSFYDDHLAGSVNPGPGPSPCHKTTYSWDYQNAHFVQLNMYYDGTTDDAGGAFGDALYNWLVEDLDNNTKPVVFVIYHEPAYPNNRGGKDSPDGWERFCKLLNDRKVIAGLCADTHQYARYQVDGDWETFTWEVDAGNAGRLSHGDPWQTFIDITVYDSGEVQFVTWQGMETEEFTVTDTWTAVAPTVHLVGPADGATVDANGAVLSCEPIAGAVSYQLMFGSDGNNMTLIAPEGAEPPTDIISTFPFEETWWTIGVRVSSCYTVYGIPRRIMAEKVSAQAIENLTKETSHGYIQDAIDKAEAGDEIVVGGGIWKHYENINFNGKNIILRSTDPNDPDVVAATVINGHNLDLGPVVTFSGSEEPNCVLAGFTITGGLASRGGGGDGNLTLAGISKCVIKGNTAMFGGGLADFSGTIDKCTIAANSATESGGGLIMCSGPITNCTISGNSAADSGGGLSRCNGPITNCAISGNLAANCGGGIRRCAGDITNCTITTNQANYGGGISAWRNDTTVTNCILRGNEAPDGPQICLKDGDALVTYSDVQGGQNDVYLYPDAELNWGEGNIDADLCFVDPDNGDYHSKSEGWRWHVQRKVWTWDDVTSRCIDAGNPGSSLENELLSIPDDPNNVWGQNLRINMGAFGGTAEASMPPYDWALLADLTNDGIVNLIDFAGQAQDWLITQNQQPGDLDRDGVVALADFALLVEDWLKQTTWHE